MGGGIGMGNTCKPMAVSFQCMTKFTTNKKNKNKIKYHIVLGNMQQIKQVVVIRSAGKWMGREIF